MILKLVTALIGVGVAFGINTMMRPQFDTHYAAGEYAQPTGTMSLSHRGGDLDVPLMTSHIVTTDVERFGRRYQVRELNLRAATSGDGWPRMDLFANMAQAGADWRGGSRDPTQLEQLELPLMPAGRLGSRTSYVVLDGDQRRNLITGSLWLTRVTPASDANRQSYDAEGRIEFQVQTETGVIMVTGKWTGKLVWDAG